MAKITLEDPATKAAREAEEAAAATAKAAEGAAAAEAAKAAEAEAAAAKKAEEDAAQAALVAAAQAKKDKGEELSDEELALLESGTADDGTVIVTIGDEAPPPPEDDKAAPQWVKELRKEHREQAKRLRELEEENKKLKAPTAQPQAAGAKPTLEGCDYDEDKFEKALTAWHDAKRKEDEAVAAKRAKETAEQDAWQKKLSGYKEDRTKFDAADFNDAETVVTTKLNVTQQGIIIQGADNPRLVVYALGKNPKKAEELAAITDPLQFAFAVAKLETQMKIAPRKAAPPPPDKPLNGGSASLAGGIDSQLDALRAEADKSGDYTKVNKYKSDKRKAEQAKK